MTLLASPPGGLGGGTGDAAASSGRSSGGGGGDGDGSGRGLRGSGGASGGSDSSGAAGGGHSGLVGHAAALAARTLADPAAGGSARHASAFVELLAARAMLCSSGARQAAHAVVQAFQREGDLRGVSGTRHAARGGGGRGAFTD